MSGTIPTVVLGASGYVGGELLRLIASHPRFELVAAVSDSLAGTPVGAAFGHLASTYGSRCFKGHAEWLDDIADGSDLALFSAAPHGASAAMIAAALEACAKKQVNVHVVDSSADFRFPTAAEWEAVYGHAHGAPELVEHFHCAVPEHVTAIDTPHVGHPGCFATAMLLAAVPLLRAGIAGPDMFVSGVTGSTGSGKSPQAGTHHPERNSNLYAYKPLAHRHAPEVERLAEAASGQAMSLHFVPHSGPFARGIHVTLQARANGRVTEADLRDAFEQAYAGQPFIQLVPGTPRLKHVVASNFCQLSVAADDGSIVVMGVIDNLVKGAAGGAVQWMNRLWNLPETAGLTMPAAGWT